MKWNAGGPFAKRSVTPLWAGVLFTALSCTSKVDETPAGQTVDLEEAVDSGKAVDSGTGPDDTAASSPPGDDSGGAPDSATPVDSSPPYDEAIFRASHNSYSGEQRGTIQAQLNAGVRQIELDFHDNDYASYGFRVGHNSPGSEVDHAHPNPSSDSLGDWLAEIAEWSASHADHAPLNVLLNIKDDMTDNRSTAEGSLAALNQLVLDAFGDSLFWSRNLGDDWPTVNGLRGKIIVGFTGRESTSSRVAYVRDQGVHPAVAINDHGQIIEVHKSESQSTLWYWTGQLQDDGTVIWWHHGRYDNGRNPVIALNNHGRFIEIHRSDGDDDLWYWTGTIGPDGDLVFQHNEEFDSGVQPSVAFDDLDGLSFREIHQSPSDSSTHWDWFATINESDGRVSWGAHGTTSDERFSTDRAESAAGWVEVDMGSHGASGIHTLLYSTSEVDVARIRYAQIAFIDTNWGDPDVLTEASKFRSFQSGERSQAEAWMDDGGIARMWKFDEGDADAMSVPIHFAATDEPLSDWYEAWATGAGAVE